MKIKWREDGDARKLTVVKNSDDDGLKGIKFIYYLEHNDWADSKEFFMPLSKVHQLQKYLKGLTAGQKEGM